MLLIVIVALITTSAFYRRAKLMGIHPGKFASIPFIAAGVILAIAYVGSLAIAQLAVSVDAASNTSHAVHFMLNLFLLALYLMLIRRIWTALTNAPP